jgi:antibiotic biosynthesis monooxygenase (ABM) superfamily enzyme
MQSASQVRRDILAALAGVLIVFSVAFCIPLANLVLTIYRDMSVGLFLSSPTLSFLPFFLLVLEVTFLAVVIYVTYWIIGNYRSNQYSEES